MTNKVVTWLSSRSDELRRFLFWFLFVTMLFAADGFYFFFSDKRLNWEVIIIGYVVIVLLQLTWFLGPAMLRRLRKGAIDPE
jgi:hypothetical protein